MQGPWEGISPGCGPPETEMENMPTVYDGAADGGGGGLLQMKKHAPLKKKRGPSAGTKKLNHWSCRAPQEAGTSGNQSCRKMKR